MDKMDDTRHDLILLNRVIAREAAALGELYDRHSRVLYGLILRIVNDSERAEEVLQEVFVQAWTLADTFDADLGTPAAWLVRMVRARAIDWLRSNNPGAGALDTRLLPATEGPAAGAELSEQQQAIARALDVLSAEERQLLEHAYFLGLTQSELAERFGLPPDTVKTRMHSALVTLRRELQQTVAEARWYQV
jgi:RNA polymerase sigma-70 factor (ECF subfamily)